MKTRIILTADFPDDDSAEFVLATTKILRARVDEIQSHLQHNSDAFGLGMTFSVGAQEFKQKPRGGIFAWFDLMR